MRVVILDAQYLIRRVMGQGELNTLEYNNIHTGAIYGFINTIKSIISILHPSFVIGVWDAGKSARRRLLLPDYKNKHLEEATDEALEEYDKFIKLLIQQIELSETFFSLVGIPSVRIPRREGDDAIYFVSQLFPQHDITIVSEDHDFLHLVNKQISVFKPRAGKLVTIDNFYEMTKIKSPDHDLLVNSCTSDPAEHPGIPGVAGGTGVKYVHQIPDGQVNLDGLENVLKDADTNKTLCRRGRLLLDNFHIVRRNYELINIRLEEFTIEDRMTVKEQFLSTPLMDEDDMRDFLSYLGMKDWLSKFDSFLYPFVPLVTVENFLYSNNKA